MAIYPDKRAGKLNGRWRVELQRGAERYRKRHDDYEAAETDEKRVLAIWEAGGSLKDIPEPEAPKGPATGLTIAEAIQHGKGKLWIDADTADTCWAHVEFAAKTLGPDTAMDAIGTHEADKIAGEVARLGKSGGTVNRYLSHLRTFLVWSKDRGYRTIPVNRDTIAFPWRKEAKGRIRWLSYEEEAEIISLVPDNVGKLIKIALETGCRRDELLSAKLNQIEGNTLHLWDTKTDDDRHVPMSPDTTALLRELIEQRKMPTKRNLRSWWDRAKTKMGLDGDTEFVFHACRHTRATRLVDAGVDVLVIQKWLGHRRIETTKRYAKVRPRVLEDALRRVGEFEARAREEASISGLPHRSPPLPHGGVIAPSKIAA